MLDIVIRVVINAIALIAAIYVVPGATFTGEGEPWKLVALAAVFGLVNAYLRPIVKLLSLPLTLLVFGLVGLIINTAMILVTALIGESLKLGFTLADWPARGTIDINVITAALLTAIVVSIVSTLVALVRMVTPRL